MLCGDEVQASIADLGNSLCRFGIAGQDSPRTICKSDVGKGSSGNLLVGDNSLRVAQPNINITSLRPNTGASLNWDGLEAIWKYGIENTLRKEPSEVPAMLTDGLFETNREKEELIELGMEVLGCPALFLGSPSMFAAFSMGRPTALVIDVGAKSTTISPVVDGFCLRKSVVKTDRGGRYIDNLLRSRIENAGQSLKSKFEIPQPGRQLISCHESFFNMHSNDVVCDLKKWMCFIPYKPLPADTRTAIIDSLKIPPYELPDGTLVQHRDDLCTIGEEIWFPISRIASTSGPRKRSAIIAGLPAHAHPVDTTDQSLLTDLVMQALHKSDVDVRKELCANVVFCGGGSLMDGLIPRLSHEMALILPPSIKFKVVQSLPVERLHASWIGASILSICGAFQRLWVSKADYDELGSALIVRERFVY